MYLNLPKYPRYITAALGSAFVTGGLVLMMVQLIAVDDVVLDETPVIDITEFVRLMEDKEVIVKQPEVEKPPVVKDEPTPPPVMLATLDTSGVELHIAPPAKVKPGPGSLGALVDGEHIPIVKVAPQYPRGAQTKGIEGYVVLSFTITTTGATADPVVLDSQPNGVFDRSAINAVRKFKYRPKVINGEPQSVYDVQHRLTYELANG